MVGHTRKKARKVIYMSMTGRDNVSSAETMDFTDWKNTRFIKFHGKSRDDNEIVLSCKSGMNDSV